VYYCGNVTHRSNLTLAALASATMPGIVVSGTRSSNQASAGDIDAGIDLAIIQDGPGRLYDVAASSTSEGKLRLRQRVKAALTLARAKEPGGLGFAMERVLAYEAGDSENSPTGNTAVAILAHCEGSSVALHALDAQDCVAIGTAIGAIHRLRGAFLQEESYPSFTTEKIKQQLLSWISRLSKAGHVPQEIIRSWSDIVNTSGLWSFTTCPVHGGFDDGDFLFSDTSLTAIYNWQDMQINDPARDLAWMFSKLDEPRRNALIAAYGRMMGSHLDPMIMLRANLWLQMEQVGEFISALDHADNDRILQFKAQVEHLAHQLVSRQSARQRHEEASQQRHAPSTITVGTLLDDPSRVSDDQRSYAASQTPSQKSTIHTPSDRVDSSQSESPAPPLMPAPSVPIPSIPVPSMRAPSTAVPYTAASSTPLQSVDIEQQSASSTGSFDSGQDSARHSHRDDVESQSSATIVVSKVTAPQANSTDSVAGSLVQNQAEVSAQHQNDHHDESGENVPDSIADSIADSAETILIPHQNFRSVAKASGTDSDPSRPSSGTIGADADGEQSMSDE
jgi:aminoglycoside phosphotransferase (APT) family kinase protein